MPTGLAVGLYDTDDELRAALARYRVRDYKRLKIKIQRGRDIMAVRAVREVLGDFPFFVDANADYTRQDAGNAIQSILRDGVSKTMAIFNA